jgi:hypothetical protein
MGAILMDNFHEQLVSTEKSLTYKLANYGFYILIFLAVVSMSFIALFGLYLVLAAAVFFIKKQLYVEYEYAFTNGEMDIDKIVEAKKRSRVLNFDIKNAELLAPEDSQYVKDFANKPGRVLKLYPKNADRKVYVAMITRGNERLQLRFTPDEEILNLCYKYNPRAVKKS